MGTGQAGRAGRACKAWAPVRLYSNDMRRGRLGRLGVRGARRAMRTGRAKTRQAQPEGRKIWRLTFSLGAAPKAGSADINLLPCASPTTRQQILQMVLSPAGLLPVQAYRLAVAMSFRAGPPGLLSCSKIVKWLYANPIGLPHPSLPRFLWAWWKEVKGPPTQLFTPCLNSNCHGYLVRASHNATYVWPGSHRSPPLVVHTLRIACL